MECDTDRKYCEDPIGKIGPYILVSFVIGLLFGSVSRGMLSYALWLLFAELPYAVLVRFKYTPQNTIKRLSFYSAGLIGFLIARIFICDDYDPIRPHYDDRPSYTKAARSLLLLETSDALRSRRARGDKRLRGVFSARDTGA